MRIYAFYVFFTFLSKVIEDNMFLDKPASQTDMKDFYSDKNYFTLNSALTGK